MARSDAQLNRRVARILEQIDELPTLSAVAVRLLEVTSADDTDADDVVELVTSDPALSGKVLQLCRRANRPLTLRDASIDRAVVMLGFDAVRAAVLSVQVFETFDGAPSRGGETFSDAGVFDRVAFWHHSLAVAAAAERLVAETPLRSRVKRSEAFLAGLLHDLGQIALHFLLPKTYDRIADAAETRGLSIDQACHLVLGMDTHTVGKRLAEHWQLPAELIEVVWLNGQPSSALPATSNRALIDIITLADLLARQQMLHPAGHGPRGEDLAPLVASLAIPLETVKAIGAGLHEEVGERASGLGLPTLSTQELVGRSLDRANEMLRRRDQEAARQPLHPVADPDARPPIIRFLDEAMRIRSLVGVMGLIARTTARAFTQPATELMLLSRGQATAETFRFDAEGRLIHHGEITPPVDDQGSIDLPATGRLAELPAWLGRAAASTPDAQALLFGESDAASRVALFIEAAHMEEAVASWRWPWHAALTFALEYEQARQMSEQLAESHRLVHEMQEELGRARTMAALGELAAGAAHEMNNPLTVISGRTQLLAARLTNPSMKSMALEVMRQSHRLSDLITSLRLYAEEPTPFPRAVNLIDITEQVVREARERVPMEIQVKVRVAEAMPTVFTDQDHFAQALRELVLNAVESQPSSMIEVHIHVDPLDDRLLVEVIDDGYGLSDHAARHAFDPFFSEKPAGRRPGLGLPRARRLVEANHGRVTLRSRKPRGTTATLAYAKWRTDEVSQQRSAA